MNLYVLKPGTKNKPDEPLHESLCGWDVYIGFVVCARSTKTARREAAEHSGNGVWNDPEYTTCEYIGVAGAKIKAGIVLDSYRSG